MKPTYIAIMNDMILSLLVVVATLAVFVEADGDVCIGRVDGNVYGRPLVS